jgi:transposase
VSPGRCIDLPHSDGCFVKAYPAETAEAFCDGHVAAFDFLGGVPQSIRYDNSKLAVAKIVKSGKRLRTKMFAELQSHYLFEDCQSASDRDPRSASNRDPLVLRFGRARVGV